MFRRTLSALAIVALLFSNGWAVASETGPQGSVRRLMGAHAWTLVAGNTVTFEGVGVGGAFRTQVYVGYDGRGWQVSEPLPGSAARYQRFQVQESFIAHHGGWCRVRTPSFEEMPANRSLTWACNGVATDASGAVWLYPANWREGDPLLRVVSILPGDMIPPALKVEWQNEVASRFGGQMPQWTAPVVSPPPRG